MDDVWGNAWSTAGPSKDTEAKTSNLNDTKWSAFERDADDETADVASPSWNVGAGAGWEGTQSNLWHSEPSTSDAWGSHVARHVSDAEDEESAELPVDEEEAEGAKDLSPKPVLPTPPQSPLPLPSPPPVPSPAAEDTPPSSPARVQSVPGSPDPFGSFESAEVADAEYQQPLSWAPKTPDFPAEATDEPWGGAWGSTDEGKEEEEENDETARDEWELAQEAKRRQERKVPPQLLGSLVAQWDEYAKEFPPSGTPDDTGSQSWRKGLDNVEGLADLVESLVPAASFPPPAQFSKTAVFRALKESIRLTRSLHLTRSSPMAHLYASKGSTDWERSVKAQKTAANDEWGWDLKHELEDKAESIDSAKERKGGGLLSFWARKTSTTPNAPTGDLIASTQPKSPTVALTPMSPPTSAQPNIEVSLNPSPATVASPSVPVAAPATDKAEADPPDGSAAHPSAVSRFFNRFSRKPSAATTSPEKDNRSSLAFSADDLSALSDMVPSTSRVSVDSGSGTSSLLHRGHDSVGSLEAMLISEKSGTRSSKLPPPLAPPPAVSSRVVVPATKSPGSESSFDAKMADVQLLDILENMGRPSSGPGYAPVSFDLIDSPEEPNPRTSTLQSPAIPSPTRASFSASTRQQPLSQRSSWLTSPNTILSPDLPPSLPPLVAPPRPEARVLAPTTPPPLSPLRRSFNGQRYDNPLPPTPPRQVDDFSEFFSATPLPSQPHSGVSSSSATFTARQTLPAAFGAEISADLGDFGDFISPSVQSPAPPQVPWKSSRPANHKPTIELVQQAASMTGQWPAPHQPLPRPLAPPPGAGTLTFRQQAQRDLLSDDSPSKPSPTSGVLIAPALSPMFADSSSRPASASSISRLTPPLPAMPTSRPASTTPSSFTAAPVKPPAKSGLSAQDLSFFEGL